MRSSQPTRVYLEAGKQRVFAGAVEWQGWSRSGRDEDAALDALLEYAPRYGRVLKGTRLGFEPPHDRSALRVVERVQGGMGTDFGAPEVPPPSDSRAVDDAELARLRAILKACWRAFDRAVRSAAGKELRKGPRGGGRDLEHILEHALEADRAYLARLGGTFKRDPATEAHAAYVQLRKAIMETLGASARGEIPAKGPRGGVRWSPRYFVRRSAWHVLDHAWELEDRTV